MVTTLNPAQTALLVMDYQPGIIARLGDAAAADALLENTAAAIADTRAHGASVGWVRVGFTDEDFEAIPAHSVMGGVVSPERRAAMHANATGTQVQPSLDKRDGDVEVRKVRVGAFSTTDLHQQLNQRQITTLVLAGLSTSGVVLSTFREAMDLDYRLFVLADASGDPQPEHHDYLTDSLFPNYGAVLTTGELVQSWAQ